MERQRPSEIITGLPDPAAELPWSADFVMQALEVLPVVLRDGSLLSLGPEHADSFVVGWPASQKPEAVASTALSQLGLQPIVLHSTSWRHSGDEVVLTYLAVVPAEVSPPTSWRELLIEHAELARGGVDTPPPVTGVSQVLEHALRHLAWLVREDAAIKAALPGWQEALAGYVPEPFRALGGPIG